MDENLVNDLTKTLNVDLESRYIPSDKKDYFLTKRVSAIVRAWDMIMDKKGRLENLEENWNMGLIEKAIYVKEKERLEAI